MKKVCFTAVSDEYYYPEGTHIFVNSFKKFHPDIDLVVFRQDTVDKLFKKHKINWYQAKPYFAELLMNDYDLVVNIDADTIILDRLTEVFDNVNYEVASAWNYNDYENASIPKISERMYLQAGLVASTNKYFWRRWQEMNHDAMQYLRKENDILNQLVYLDMPFLKLKIVDKYKDYYGCKSLGREQEFEIKKGKTYCRGQQVRAYHYARGGAFPKLDIYSMPLSQEVKENWLNIAMYGTTVMYKGVKSV